MTSILNMAPPFVRVLLAGTTLSLAAVLSAASALAATATSGPVVVLAAGDIARCDFPLIHRIVNTIIGPPIDAYKDTARLLDQLDGTILALGDLVSDKGTAEEFLTCYDPAWGRHRARTLPTPGNHEYETAGAAPYFSYFGARAGEPGKGYYSTDLGAWHIVSLNSQLPADPRSPQIRWLRKDLATSSARCVLAFWHVPPFHGGPYARPAAQLFRAAYELGVSVVLTGHDHAYERLAPRDGAGRTDFERGVRTFIVGTGGAPLHGPPESSEQTEASQNETWGLLKLTLHDGAYEWRFLRARGRPFTDAGTAACVDRPHIPPGHAEGPAS